MDAAVDTSANQVDVAIANRTTHRHLSERRRTQPELLPPRAEQLLEHMLRVAPIKAGVPAPARIFDRSLHGTEFCIADWRRQSNYDWLESRCRVGVVHSRHEFGLV